MDRDNDKTVTFTPEIEGELENRYISITLQKINKILHNFFRRTLWKQD